MSVTRTEPRAQDGLTKAERASLRDPHSYEVMECNPCRFLVSSRECFADFEVVIGYGRWVRMTSNTGTTLDLTIGEECPCMDSLHRGGDCKHAVVLGVVLEYRATEADAVLRAA